MIHLSSVVVLLHEGHLGDLSRIALVADLNLHLSSGLVHSVLDVSHGHGLLQGRRQGSGGDLTNNLSVGVDLGSVTSGSTAEHETHTLLLAGLHLFVKIQMRIHILSHRIIIHIISPHSIPPTRSMMAL